jgi:Flp pilus assembly pilin Flp
VDEALRVMRPRFCTRRHEDAPLLLLPIKRLLRDDRGASLVEYCLAVGMIAILCTVAIAYLGSKIHAMWAYWGSF